MNQKDTKQLTTDQSVTQARGGLLTPEQVAQALGMHVASVRRSLRLGTIPGGKIGGQWFTRRGDLLQMISEERAS